MKGTPFFISSLIFIVSILSGCTRHSAEWKQLQLANQLIENHADSALAIIESVKAENLKDGEEKACYALLKSMALDKHYVTISSFDELQPAIDYYLTQGTPNDKIRTYYLRGKIYYNQGNDDLAMKSFFSATDLECEDVDALVLANAYEMLGSLFYKQYKADEYASNNLKAASLYRNLGDNDNEKKCLSRSLIGATLYGNKSLADSLYQICLSLEDKQPRKFSGLTTPIIIYQTKYGSDEELCSLLSDIEGFPLNNEAKLTMANGYLRLSRYDDAINMLDNAEMNGVQDSLKYLLIKKEALEKLGKYQDALDVYTEFTKKYDEYHSALFSEGLMFAEKEYKLEIDHLKTKQEKNRIIWLSFCGLFLLIIILGVIYHRYHMNKAKRIIAEQENFELKLSQKYLRNEKEKLEAERDNLIEFQKNAHIKDRPIMDVVRKRLDILNSLLAKEITGNKGYIKAYDSWIESIRQDKHEFINSTRIAFTASHPAFIRHLESFGLTIDEINYLCLYGLGLRGKEVGEYMQIKSHYNISSAIRKKMGIDEHETNIGPYIRRLLTDLDK